MAKSSTLSRRRTTTRGRVSFGKFAFQASHASDQWFRDGEDSNSSGVNPTVNTTNSLLLAAYGDFAVASADSGYAKSHPRIKRVIFNAFLHPTETTNQIGTITFQWWFITMPSVVQTDWITNARDPNDGSLATTNNAFPHTILKTGLASFRTADAVATQAGVVCRIKADLKYPGKGYQLRFPSNLYFMIKPIIENDSAGAWASGEVAITWNVAIKAAPRLSAT